MVSEPAQRFYEFDMFLLDAQECLLFRDGQPLDLTPKLFDVLLELVQNHGRVLGKRELMEKVWPDTFVEESNLTQHISTLRKKLGQDSNRGRYILTVPGRGYRFLPTVRAWNDDELVTVHERLRARIVVGEGPGSGPELLGDGANEALTTAHPPRVRIIERAPSTVISRPAFVTSTTRSRRWWIPAIVILAGVVTLGIYAYLTRKGPPPFAKIKLAKFTTTGRAVRATISPDGKYVAHVRDEAGEKSIWLRQVATGKDLQLVPPARVEFFYGLSFSRDGNYIYYVNQEMNHLGMLFQIPSLGGTPTKVLEDVDSPVTLSPDDKHLAFIRGSPGERHLIVANVDGTGERKLFSTSQKGSLRLGQTWTIPPAWSPDGKTIAATAAVTTVGEEYQTIWGIPVNGGEGGPLSSHHWQTVGRMEWLADGSGLLTTAEEQGAGPSQQIWYVAYPGGAARKITNDLSDYRDLGLTANGKTISAVQTERKANVWIAPTTDTDHARQLTFTNYDGIGGVSWTPDGKVVYALRASEEENLWIADPAGDNLRQLTSHAGLNRQPVVSPDGRYIAFISNRNGRQHVWRIDADGTHPLELTHGAEDTDLSISPDSKWIVYRSIVSGSWRILRVGIDGGDPISLTNKTGGYPAVSPDGTQVAFIYRTAPAAPNNFAVIPFAGGDPRLIHELPAFYGRFIWSLDGRALAYGDKQTGQGNIWLQPLDGSAPKQLTHWGTAPIVSFDWSRDGKWLAYAVGSEASDVVLISDLGR